MPVIAANILHYIQRACSFMVKHVKTMTVTITELLKDNIKDIILIIYYKSFLHVHNLLPQLINSNPCGTEYFRMNGKNLIQTFVALVILLFAMHS